MMKPPEDCEDDGDSHDADSYEHAGDDDVARGTARRCPLRTMAILGATQPIDDCEKTQEFERSEPIRQD